MSLVSIASARSSPNGLFRRFSFGIRPLKRPLKILRKLLGALGIKRAIKEDPETPRRARPMSTSNRGRRSSFFPFLHFLSLTHKPLSLKTKTLDSLIARGPALAGRGRPLVSAIVGAPRSRRRGLRRHGRGRGRAAQRRRRRWRGRRPFFLFLFLFAAAGADARGDGLRRRPGGPARPLPDGCRALAQAGGRRRPQARRRGREVRLLALPALVPARAAVEGVRRVCERSGRGGERGCGCGCGGGGGGEGEERRRRRR